MVKNRSKSTEFNQKLVNFNTFLASIFDRNPIWMSDIELYGFRRLNSEGLKSELSTIQFVDPKLTPLYELKFSIKIFV